MQKLMIGNNYDIKLIDYIIEENKKYSDIKVKEVFGSIQKLNVIKTARPDFRVPDISIDKFSEICNKLNDNDIITNYTVNTPLVDHKEIDKNEYERFVNELYDLGVRRLTVAHPLVIKILGQINVDMGIELSTIYRIRHPRQLYDMKKFNPNLNKICIDVMNNRNATHLRDMKKHCDDLDIEVELLANEFCIYECLVRDQCYHAHVMNKSVEDTKYFGGWPMNYCIGKREKHPIEWLYANFILPQHMKIYQEEFGIERFKISGRTAPTPYAKWIVGVYLSQMHEGNLLELWQDVKNLSRVAKGKEDYIPQHYSIDSKKINDDFLKWYFKANVNYDNEKDHIEHYFNEAFAKIK